MRLQIRRIEGLHNDLQLSLEQSEIESARLSVANRARLMNLPGIPRHREATGAEHQAFAEAKIGIDDHLRRMNVFDAAGVPARVVAISNRNLGANHGHLAWQSGETPAIFRIAEDPCNRLAYSCLVAWRTGRISIEDLRFDVRSQRLTHASDGRDVGGVIEWATAGQRVIRDGQLVRIEELLDQFYDVRHLLAFDTNRPEGEAIRRSIYAGYPASFGDNVRRAWRETRVPRARYFHNAIGVSDTKVIVVQQEGTIEEVAAALQAAGATDGMILDNGGSVACWAWWANNYAGGLISPTIDYRPPSTSIIVFRLKGSARPELPGGSVSYSVV